LDSQTMNESLPAAAVSRQPCNGRVRRLAEAWFGVQRRAEIFEYPIREMQSRSWIAHTNDTDELERELCRFFGAPSVAAIKTMPLYQGFGPDAAAGKT
jgi:hypothetical protein